MAEIYRGGVDLERLYLKDAAFTTTVGDRVIVERSNIPGVNMKDLIARHKGRYALLGLFIRPGYNVLDFPCGSGYGSELMKPRSQEFKTTSYEGQDIDEPTIMYAARIYGGRNVHFRQGDLKSPNLGTTMFETIACIEGLEHIERKFQSQLIDTLFIALKPGGTLIISSPENPTGTSEPSSHNPFHLGELTKADFLSLLSNRFGKKNTELVTHKAILSTGVLTTCFYGVCHKSG